MRMRPRFTQSKVFPDRFTAGVMLAEDIKKLGDFPNAIVIGLARGGVPVAYSVSKVLDTTLDVLVVRKLGVPWQEELAFGAIAPDGIRILNRDVVLGTQLGQNDIRIVEERERAELERRERKYRGGLRQLSVSGQTVILVDDGLATGATMHAALEWAKQKGASKCIVAAPVASQSTCETMEQRHTCTSCICHMAPEPFYAVGQWYEDFSQVSDETVSELLKRRREELNQKLYRVANIG